MVVNFYIDWSRYPIGGFCAYDENHEALRLGVPIGNLIRKFGTVGACRKAVEKFYRKLGHQVVDNSCATFK